MSEVRVQAPSSLVPFFGEVARSHVGQSAAAAALAVIGEFVAVLVGSIEIQEARRIDLDLSLAVAPAGSCMVTVEDMAVGVAAAADTLHL